MIIHLRTGDLITPKREINRTQISNWKFAGECSNRGSGLMPGIKLKIVELNKMPGNMWVKVEIPYSDPSQYLKIAGEEFAQNFELV